MGDNGDAGESGRAQKFVEFVRRHESELRGWIHSQIHCNDGTQDVLQKAFCRAWCSSTFDPGHPHARAYVYQTAKRLIMDRRQSKETASISLEDLSQRAEMHGSRPSESAFLVDRKNRDPMAVMLAREDSRSLEVALGVLPDHYRDALERFYLRQEGNQYQIAQALGLTIATFNSRLNRARQELKRILLRLQRPDDWGAESP
jgi:RNA polymerase sigma factor (sigma-70 family)